MIRCLFVLVLALAPIFAPSVARAETALVRIGLQPGMTYLALNTMNREHLLEQRAKADGLDLKVEWIVSANGVVLNDGVSKTLTLMPARR